MWKPRWHILPFLHLKAKSEAPSFVPHLVPSLNKPPTVATIVGHSLAGASTMPNPVPPNPSTNHLIIEGARQNNLKNISLQIPHNQVTAITGVSGSGKSSLAFD